MPKLSFTPKLRRFAQNGVVLAFFFFLKKKKIKNKREIGGGMGWLKPPLCPWGWSGHPKRPKKKKNEKMGLFTWGWLDYPLGPRVGFGHLLPTVGGGFGHPYALGGGPATPCEQTHFFLFFFFGPFGVARPPHTGSRGWLQPPPISPFFLFFFPFFFFFFF
jgi:hypothetical protein